MGRPDRRRLLILSALLSLACGEAATAPAPPPNRAPEASGSIPAQSVVVGETVTLDVSSYFSDPDGDILTHTANPSDPGVISVSVSGSMVTMVGVAQGTASITITAADPGGLSATQQAAVTVPNRAPVAEDSIPAQSVAMGETVTLDLASYFGDPDGDALTYSVAASDPEVISVGVTGSVVTIVGVSRGTASMTVTASDPDGESAMQQVEVTVPNRPPMAIGAMQDLTTPPGDTAAVDAAPFFDDPDGDELTYAATTSDDGVAEVSMSGSEATVVGVSPGTATISVTASDPDGLSADQSFQVLVPRPGTVVGIILVAQEPNPPPGQGFQRDMFGYMALLYRQGIPCDRPCHQVAVAMGSDTVLTDEYGRFVFENVRGDREYLINVVEENHPRDQRDVIPTTFWHHVIFDIASVTTVWQDTVRLEMSARQVPILAAKVHRWPPRTGEEVISFPGITVTLFASDAVTVLDRQVSDEYGEVVFRPLQHGVTYFLSPVDGYDRTRYRCDDRKMPHTVQARPYISCRDFDASLTDASALDGGGGVSQAGSSGHDDPPATARGRRLTRRRNRFPPGHPPLRSSSTMRSAR